MDIQVYGYKSLYIQLFQNLISNAIKYHDKNKKPEVAISFDLLESSALVKIKENGIGITENDIDNIYKPFIRVNSNEEIAGLGIGLDTCSLILKNIGSELNVASKLGVGTTFSFEIPLY